MRRLVLLALLVLVALSGACVGTETGNPYTAALSYTARTSDSSRVALVSGAAPVVVTSAWVSISEFHLDEHGTCAAPTGSPEDGAHTLDLVAGEAPSQFPVAPGAYCGARTVLSTASAPLPTGAPPELDGAVFVVSGTVAGTPFTIRSASAAPLTLALQTDAGAFLLEPDRAALAVGLDVAGLLGGVDLSTIPPQPDGTIRVDPTHDAAILATIQMSVGAGTSLFHDDDADGHVSTAEAAMPLAHGSH